MAMLGVARVLVAHACATRSARPVVALVAGTAALQTGLLLLLADDAAGMVTATLIATATLTAGAGILALPRATPVVRALSLARRRDVVPVAALSLMALALRLLCSRGIWLDEATSVWQAQMSLGDMMHTLRTTDVHPPLHHLVLWLTVHVLGTAEPAVRLSSLLAATALVPVLYAAGRDLYDRRAGLAAAALGAVAPFAVWYAQEARMYALFMLFALIAVWMQARVLRDGRRRDWVGFTLAAFALVATQYFGLLLVGVQQLAFLVALWARRRDRARLRRLALPWLASCVVLALMLAPLLAFAQDQFAANESAGKGFQQVPSQTGGALDDSAAPPGSYAALTNAVWALLGYHSDATMTRLVALWPLLMLLGLALLGRGRSWRTSLIVAAAVLPALALFVLGQLKPFVFEARYFIGAVPLVLLVAGRAATSWSLRPGTRFAAVAVATALLAGGLADQQLNGNNPRVYDFRGALDDIAEHARPGDVLVYSPQYLEHVVKYYAAGVDARPLDRGLPKPRRGQRVIVLGSFLDKPQYRAATAKAVRTLDRRHELAAERRYPQIRVWEFTR
jgi:4-amino-4-deoxy-L-arabinose transferase-like glycosyltransferase